MFLSAAQAKLNVYSDDQHFQQAIDEITAAQAEGSSDFDVNVQFLDDDQVADLISALFDAGYTAHFNDEAAEIIVRYE